MTYQIVLKDGRFDAEAGSGPATLASLIQQVAAEDPAHLVVHLHGGLVSRQNGEASAEALDPSYREAGAIPLFLIWESGWQEILQQRLTAVSQDGLFQRILARVAQFARGKVEKELGPSGSKGLLDEMPLMYQYDIDQALGRGKAGAPMFPGLDTSRLALDAVSAPDAGGLDPAEVAQIQQELSQDILLTQQLQAATTEMDPGVLDLLGAARVPGAQDRGIISTVLLAKRVVAIVARVVWRFSHRRDHGFYLTAVEEVLREFYVGAIGKFLWDGMKSGIANAFTDADAGGTALVLALQQMWTQGIRPKVTLVGHSAGAIYAARLLKELHGAMPVECKIELVLIAPACTFTVLADALSVAGSRITGVRVFGMGDEYERRDAIASVIYPASLLYFVSGVLEDAADEPLVGMQRYYADPYDAETFQSVAAVKAFDYFGRSHAFAWSMIDGFVGGMSDMTSHGGWTEAAKTKASVMAIIKQGYGYA